MVSMVHKRLSLLSVHIHHVCLQCVSPLRTLQQPSLCAQMNYTQSPLAIGASLLHAHHSSPLPTIRKIPTQPFTSTTSVCNVDHPPVLPKCYNTSFPLQKHHGDPKLPIGVHPYSALMLQFCTDDTL